LERESVAGENNPLESFGSLHLLFQLARPVPIAVVLSSIVIWIGIVACQPRINPRDSITFYESNNSPGDTSSKDKMLNEPLPSSMEDNPQFKEETSLQKFRRRLKEEPLIPLGELS
jgi:hypothetical protein